jgi:hypothetical protein
VSLERLVVAQQRQAFFVAAKQLPTSRQSISSSYAKPKNDRVKTVGDACLSTAVLGSRRYLIYCLAILYVVCVLNEPGVWLRWLVLSKSFCLLFRRILSNIAYILSRGKEFVVVKDRLSRPKPLLAALF